MVILEILIKQNISIILKFKPRGILHTKLYFLSIHYEIVLNSKKNQISKKVTSTYLEG